MAARLIDGFHEAFSCVDGEKDKATKALVKSARKILFDVKHTLRYKAVMQCRLLDDKGEKMTRKTPFQTNLEKEEYVSVESELGRSVHILEAWKEGHKGKGGAEFCRRSAHERYDTFTEVFHEVQG
ncbi:Glutamate decarboxylase 1 [Hordeum vulgare]|nr:Glutamate decarboxylase 1 [Hordeum vulgare]